METSYKFKYIEKNLLSLFSLICGNQNISKYVYYLNDDPLSSNEVQVDLLSEGYYFLTFFDGSIPEQEKIRIFLNPMYGDFKNYPLSNIAYSIEIVVPINYWVLHGRAEIRPIRILDEISQMIDQQKVAGITEVEITKFRSGRISNSNYCVFSAEIIINSSSMKGLR